MLSLYERYLFSAKKLTIKRKIQKKSVYLIKFLFLRSKIFLSKKNKDINNIETNVMLMSGIAGPVIKVKGNVKIRKYEKVFILLIIFN